MKTDDLIARLSAGQPARQSSPALVLGWAVVVAMLFVGAAVLLSLGLRPDFAEALLTWRFDMKFVVTLTLSASAFFLLRSAVYPEGLERAPLWIVLAAPALLLGAVLYELAVLPAAAWRAALVGSNWLHCLTMVPLFGIVPLVIALWALRQGATTRPVLTGFLAGLLAGGIGATFYAANCPDDSPLFVVTWYPVGILGLGVIGAIAARRVLRW
jgi:hypothetical protein